MYMYMYMCMYMYMYMYMPPLPPQLPHTHTHTQTQTHTRTRAHARAHTHVAAACARTHTRMPHLPANLWARRISAGSEILYKNKNLTWGGGAGNGSYAPGQTYKRWLRDYHGPYAVHKAHILKSMYFNRT
jgi:hypothetical protein